MDSALKFPRLPFTRQEAERVYALVRPSDGRRALDFDAAINLTAGSELAQYRILHFATHGLVNAENLELSGLVLSLVDEQGRPQSGFLSLAEIYSLRLNADLVVLSACQSGLGKEIKGEGLVGLTRGFMYAGARSVVASLWKVNDAATAELMERFYRGILVRRMRPTAALRAAQIAIYSQERFRFPYYWAAFVTRGEWR